MKLSKIAAYTGAGLLTVSCNVKEPHIKALKHASKYLKGSELVVAEEKAQQIIRKDITNHAAQIFYWDSLLSVNKEKDSFKKGIEYIKDSVNGNVKRKLPIHISAELDTDKTEKEILGNIKKEVAEYYSREEFLDLERKAPKYFGSEFSTNEGYVTHYYGTLAVQGAERKGFNEGLVEGRKKFCGKD